VNTGTDCPVFKKADRFESAPRRRLKTQESAWKCGKSPMLWQEFWNQRGPNLLNHS
jgi:hypothetical protein